MPTLPDGNIALLVVSASLVTPFVSLSSVSLPAPPVNKLVVEVVFIATACLAIT